jgi:hypothetical protein
MYSYYKNVEILNKSFRNYSARTKQIQRKLTNQSEYYNYQKSNKRYILHIHVIIIFSWIQID